MFHFPSTIMHIISDMNNNINLVKFKPHHQTVKHFIFSFYDYTLRLFLEKATAIDPQFKGKVQDDAIRIHLKEQALGDTK